MRVDLRVKHGIEARKAAIGLFVRGHGLRSAARALSVPRGTVRQWLYVYRSFGSEVLLSMNGKFIAHMERLYVINSQPIRTSLFPSYEQSPEYEGTISRGIKSEGAPGSRGLFATHS